MASPGILVVDDNKELVALLTSLFEEAGYAVTGASKGRAGIDEARTAQPQVAVVDVLLPDMMGYHVAEGIRTAAPGVHLIFMSGVFRGARHSGEALARFPGASYLEKPFDARALLELVTRLVPPPAAPPPTRRPPPAASESMEVELDIDVEESDAEDSDHMELTGRIKVTGGGNITAELHGATLTAGPPLKGPIAGDRPLFHLEPESNHGRPPRTGILEDNLPGLITAFFLSRETGELYCQKGKVKKVVYFEGGQPVFALSNLAADRFGQFLVRVGKIKPEQLNDSAVVAAQSGRRTGDVLVERGLLKDTERLYYVGQQVKSIIYSLFGWETGQFTVTFREKARSEVIKLDVFPGNLIVRGVKKLYKPARLARLVPLEDRYIPTQQPAYQLHEIELEKWEAMLLPRIDGTRTVEELIALAQKPDHQVRGFVAAMVSTQVLEKRES